MKEERSQNVTIQNEVRGRGLFYGIIAIATFIIMAVGTTFAYFTATTNSADASVQTGSTTLRLRYIGYEGAWMSNDLIPANTEVVEYSFEYQDDTTLNQLNDDYQTMRYNTMCKDDYGNSICSVYVFQVVNSANSPQSVSLDVQTIMNGFGNLYSMAYEISEPTDSESDDYKNYFPEVDEETGEKTFLNNLNGIGDPIFRQFEEDTTEGAQDVRDGDGIFVDPSQYKAVYVNRKGVKKTLLRYYKTENELSPAIDRQIKVINPENPEDNSARIADNITIDGKSSKTFALVLYIKNLNEDQTDADASKTFSGKVIVSSGDGKVGVSGTINVSETKELQSGSSLETTEPDDDENGLG